jgi:hypothetical protein
VLSLPVGPGFPNFCPKWDLAARRAELKDASKPGIGQTPADREPTAAPGPLTQK